MKGLRVYGGYERWNRTDDSYNSKAESKWETLASPKWEFRPRGDLKIAWHVCIRRVLGGWRFRESVPKLDGVEQSETTVVLPELQGTYTLLFS